MTEKSRQSIEVSFSKNESVISEFVDFSHSETVGPASSVNEDGNQRHDDGGVRTQKIAHNQEFRLPEQDSNLQPSD
jgi:hypothetical protein